MYVTERVGNQRQEMVHLVKSIAVNEHIKGPMVLTVLLKTRRKIHLAANKTARYYYLFRIMHIKAQIIPTMANDAAHEFCGQEKDDVIKGRHGLCGVVACGVFALLWRSRHFRFHRPHTATYGGSLILWYLKDK